jgi:DNA invertase Pin-like site-specific DNA recombinase
MDQLSLSLAMLITELQMFESLGLGFCSIRERIETVTPGGKLFFHMVGAFAQFERDVIRERINAGLDAARRAGKILGRPPQITPEQSSAEPPRSRPETSRRRTPFTLTWQAQAA